MRAKLSVLRACFRVLKPGGRIAHYTIYAPPDLDASNTRKISAFWPAAKTRGRWHRELLEAAGFERVEETDVTREYRETVRGWLEGRRRHFDGLAEALGEDVLKGKIVENEVSLQKVDEGLLRRSLVTGQRPG